MSSLRKLLVASALLAVSGGLASAVIVARRLDRVAPATSAAPPAAQPNPHRRGALDAPGFVGVLVANQTVDVAAKLEGRLIDVKVRPGAKVTTGTVLAIIDAS